MFAWWGTAVVRLRWWVMATALAVVVVGAAWGSGVFGALTGGGYADKNAESQRAYSRIAAELGQQDPDLVLLWSTGGAPVDAPAVKQAIGVTVEALRHRPEVASVTSYLETPLPSLVSKDRHATYAAVRLKAGDEDTKVAAYHALEPQLGVAGMTTEVGGGVAFLDAANAQTEKDIARAEIFSLPVLLILLILIFRGVVAALSP